MPGGAGGAGDEPRLIQQMRAQGFQVDARLIHVQFRNVPTGMTCRGTLLRHVLDQVHQPRLASLRPGQLGAGRGVRGMAAAVPAGGEDGPGEPAVDGPGDAEPGRPAAAVEPQSAKVHRRVEPGVRRLHEHGAGRRVAAGTTPATCGARRRSARARGSPRAKAPRSTRPTPGASKAPRAGSTARPTTRPTSPARTPGPAASWSWWTRGPSTSGISRTDEKYDLVI